MAARTFIMRRLVAGDSSGVPVPGADVTDTVSHQAYVSQAALERDWVRGGKSAGLAKLRRAVRETRGVIMTYKGQPITASFFASSGGYTENSEDYWNAAVPYLRSVASPWEQEITPNLAVTYTFSISELIGKLGLSAKVLPASKDLAAFGGAKVGLLFLCTDACESTVSDCGTPGQGNLDWRNRIYRTGGAREAGAALQPVYLEAKGQRDSNHNLREWTRSRHEPVGS